MIPAHGATLSFTSSEVTVTYGALLAALTGRASDTVPLRHITGIATQPPTALSGGWVDIARDDAPDLRVRFSPRADREAAAFADALSAAQRGETPPTIAPVIGLDFVALDVETANADNASICQIGVVRYRDGIAEDSASWLCQPPQPVSDFDSANVAIHGIRAEDVAQAPSCAEAIAHAVEFVGSDVFVAHNAQFDASALFRASRASDSPVPQLRFGCSLALSRRSDLSLKNHKLPTVAEELGITPGRHHDAHADAQACGDIVVALARREGFSGSIDEFFAGHRFSLGRLEEDRVYPVLSIRKGATGATGSAGKAGKAGRAAAGSTSAAHDGAQGQLFSAAKKPRRAPWKAVATPDTVPEANPDADPHGLLFDQHVTLSGDFEPYDKGQLWAGIAQRGGHVGKNVTKKTTILVAGAWTTKTSKHKRAEELIAAGQHIDIWTADELIAALGLEEQPPF